MDYQAVKKFILDKLRSELSAELTYHGVHHTLDVLDVAEELCARENISEYNTILVKTAALFHDAGFVIGSNKHEEYSCQIASYYLPKFGYKAKDILQINKMILATKVPQNPQDKLSQLLCDADLDYLGRDDFHEIASTLFEELKARAVVEEIDTWNAIQVNFLEQHEFFTSTNIQRRSSKKQQHLNELKELLSL